MRLVTFLNELSHPSDRMSDGEAKQNVSKLIKLLREIKRIRSGLELHSIQPLVSVNMGNQRTLSSLRADGNTREEWQFLRGLENRAFDLSGELHDLAIDYEHKGVPCVGLGLAHAIEALAVSFEGADWSESSLELVCRELANDGELSESFVYVRHAATEENLADLREWLRLIPLENYASGEEMWARRAEAFPSLLFLPRTEQQIVPLKYGSEALGPVNLRLWQLECAAQNWEQGRGLPSFLSKVTPEHEQRKGLCQFESVASGVQYFDLHARYTPGAGRIHMWCNPENHTIEIGHIGHKL